MLWAEAIRVAVIDGRLDLAGGLDLLPVEHRDQWAAWITEAETKAPGTFRNNGFTVVALQAAWSAIVLGPLGWWWWLHGGPDRSGLVVRAPCVGLAGRDHRDRAGHVGDSTGF